MNFHFRPQSYGHIPKAIADDRKWNERPNGPMDAFLQSAREGRDDNEYSKRWCPKPARSFVVSVNCVTNEKRNPCVHYVSQPWRSLPPARVQAAGWLPSSCESLVRRTVQRSTNPKMRRCTNVLPSPGSRKAFSPAAIILYSPPHISGR